MLTNTIPAETDVLKLSLPLSRSCVVLVLFDGSPDAECFARLKQALDVMAAALMDDQPKVAAPEVLTPITEKIAPKSQKPAWRVMKELPPCKLHPESGRYATTNRCIACTAEHVRKMRRAAIA